ncbi:glycoside hydrolase family 88/105 protein [Coraliomargarita akajimensis]|uniref:Glycosyl hydrolase family 88 n=1 Tax=Coraliomargarita akajimensis (strain DSM 45221 / IAM 15411 / JCM 23193 / KCTC 12865 / 04OKA010-24) TaxID=583355 RepID=D5EQS7_CORAD|nr:glycoside hydrolase family 88 protein [Coraliomargarita akajimensis]ADE53920.1 glycosyl hydrolase family 88 [Coraliomargarita akajimensis DSM 45221]
MMKKKNFVLFTLALVVCAACALAEPSPESVKAEMKRVADWQIEHLRDDIGRYHEADNRLDAWTFGALYVGMEKWAAMAETDAYYTFLKGVGDELNWKLNAKYHADWIIVGQMYLDMYRKYGDPKMLTGIQQRLEWIKANPSQQPINLNHYKHTERWTWCDALFMAPPAWAMLANITEDQSFNEFMFAEYKATYDHLYDPETKLFFRDEHYINARDHGRKVFWSRGNGWVFGSLALIIPELPEGAMKDWFIALYQDMAPAVAALQTEAGHWPMSLLCGDIYETPETSGTAFFCYGLAWGINTGLISEERYRPVVLKGWESLVSHIDEDGLLGYVQPVGAAPGKAWPDKSEVYGVGAFLAAGSEIYQLLSE